MFSSQSSTQLRKKNFEPRKERKQIEVFQLKYVTFNTITCVTKSNGNQVTHFRFFQTDLNTWYISYSLIRTFLPISGGLHHICSILRTLKRIHKVVVYHVMRPTNYISSYSFLALDIDNI